MLTEIALLRPEVIKILENNYTGKRILAIIVSGYDQEIPQSHAADQHTAP